MTLTVTRLMFNQDLRSIHKIRSRVRCKQGECWLFINGAETMARIVDHRQSVHCYWAPEGHKIDVGLLTDLVSALRLELRIGQSAKTKAARAKMKLAA